MKKFPLIIFIFLISAQISIITHANTDKYDTMFDLLQAWDEHYPDYVCGIWSNDGTEYDLTLALIDGEEGETAKNEILDLIKDDNSVKFTTMKYSRNYLLSIQESLYNYFGSGIGLQAMGLRDTENKVVVEIKSDYINNAETKDFIKYIEETFDDAVRVEFTDAIIKTTVSQDPYTPTLKLPESVKNDNTVLYFSAAVITVLILSATVLMLGKSKNKALVTADGEISTEKRITNKEIERQIKDAALSPSEELDKKVFSSTNEI